MVSRVSVLLTLSLGQRFLLCTHRISLGYLCVGAVNLSRANLVPTHQLISDDDSYVRLAHSAVDAGMNTIRLWGGTSLFRDRIFLYNGRMQSSKIVHYLVTSHRWRITTRFILRSCKRKRFTHFP